jgi:hypothetical protein
MAEAAPAFGNETNLLLRGAQDIGAGGLLRFYLLHIFFLPLLAILLISIHYYKVAREHSISLPAPIEEGTASPEKIISAKKRIDIIPDLITSELMWAAIGLTVMILIVIFWYEAPLETHANPLRTPLHTKAPWYFWFLQGMLKIGDKTLWGVIIPAVMYGLVCLVPYTDDPNINPFSHTSRLATKRKFSNAMGVVTTIIMVVFSFMGTHKYGVSAPPPVEIVQEFLPEEGKGYHLSTCKAVGGCDGAIRAIPYEELIIGSFDTREEAKYPGGLLDEVMHDFVESITRHLPDDVTAYGILEIEQSQHDVKRMEMTIHFMDEETGTPNQYSKPVYIHEHVHYEGF